MELNVSLLHKATISYDYLHSNSTTHEFLFGAIAELVDNSRDADAKNLQIEIDDAHQNLSFIDDGCGMSREEAEAVVSFGQSNKKMEKNKIGQYGNGLKSGAMRLAKDFIIFTKKDGMLTCLLLSRTFHEKNKLKDVLVPTPSFYYCNEDQSLHWDSSERHDLEMKIIYQYSPFANLNDLMEQFCKIPGDHGTCIVLFNLRRIENGDTELDFISDSDDIRLSDHVHERHDAQDSLRAYLSILYIAPIMKIHLRYKKVITQRILDKLYKPYKYLYLPKKFKSCASRDLGELAKSKQEASEKCRQALSELGVVKSEMDPTASIVSEARKRERLAQAKVAECQALYDQCEEMEAAFRKNKGGSPPLTMYFGVNIHHRNQYGCMIYNNGRLIEMYEKTEAQKEKNDSAMMFLGVVGIIDIPYSVLAPTHNKQSFENKREYSTLLRALNDYMEQYWEDIALVREYGNISAFWKLFGYDSTAWNAHKKSSLDHRMRCYRETGHAIQCVNCLKWRRLKYSEQFMNEGIPDSWSCIHHPVAQFRHCNRAEDGVKAREGQMNPARRNNISYSTRPKSDSQENFEICRSSDANNNVYSNRNNKESKREISRAQLKRDDSPELRSGLYDEFLNDESPPPRRRSTRSTDKANKERDSESEDSIFVPDVRKTRINSSKPAKSSSSTQKSTVARKASYRIPKKSSNRQKVTRKASESLESVSKRPRRSPSVEALESIDSGDEPFNEIRDDVVQFADEMLSILSEKGSVTAEVLIATSGDTFPIIDSGEAVKMLNEVLTKSEKDDRVSVSDRIIQPMMGSHYDSTDEMLKDIVDIVEWGMTSVDGDGSERVTRANLASKIKQLVGVIRENAQ